MQQAIQTAEDGSLTLINADGTKVGTADSDRRVLHLVPKLLLSPGQVRAAELSSVRLELISDYASKLIPESGIEVRQPYPNPNYLVGGSASTRNGWCVDPTGLPDSFLVEFRWTLTGQAALNCSGEDHWIVRHIIRFTLLEGSARTHTMEMSDWLQRGAKAPPIYLEPIAVGRINQLTPKYQHRDFMLVAEIDHQELGNLPGVVIEERFSVPPIPYEQATAIHAHAEKQLHELTRSATFASQNEEHYACSQSALPAHVLHKAIALARSVPYRLEKLDDGLDHSGYLEDHPAMKLLCEWWAANRPSTANPLKAGMAMPYVRVNEEDGYYSGYGECPNEMCAWLAEQADSNATCGDAIVVEFWASLRLHRYDEDGNLEILFSNGRGKSQIGVGEHEVRTGAYDEAWYCLEALAGFPHNFPEAYAQVQQNMLRELELGLRKPVCSPAELRAAWTSN